jgi:hypothetical protein
MDERINHSSSSNSAPSHSVWLPILGAGLLIAGGAIVYQGIQTHALRTQSEASQQDNIALRTKLSDTDTDLRKALSSMHDEFAQSQENTGASVARAQKDAIRHADSVASQIAKKQEEQARNLADELGQVKQSGLEASTRLDGVSTEVGAVKTDVESAKSAIQDTKSELQRSRGDMGMMSGLIATNSKEIQTLRDMGERNIFEFTLAKNNRMQKVGDIQVMLRKADPKGNRFTIDVLADDKRVEKKDRTTNEPVQFYTASARQPYELVVNQVQKDKITGYLATPRVNVSRNEASVRQGVSQ